MRVGGLKFFDLFNSNKFVFLNPFLKPQVSELIIRNAASTFHEKEPSLNSHFCGALLDYKRFKFDRSIGLFKYRGEHVTTSSFLSKADISSIMDPHPAFAYLPGFFNMRDLEYWMKNEEEYVELFIKECLENGIDPAFVARSVSIRFFFCTMSKVVSKFVFNQSTMRVEGVREYDSIRLPDGSSFDVKLTKHPFILNTFEPSSDVLETLEPSVTKTTQYISTVPVDIPLNCLDSLNLTNAGSQYYGLNNFHNGKKLDLLNKLSDEEKLNIQEFYFGKVGNGVNASEFLNLINKGSVSLNYDKASDSIDWQVCTDIILSASLEV